MKKIAIVGAGEIGAFIAERLTAENFDVTIMDHNAEVLADLQSRLDVAGVHGNATNLNNLVAADFSDADLLIATTRQDETNLVACLLSRELGIPHNIAVTRYLGSRDKKMGLGNMPLGIDLIVNMSEAVKDEIIEVVETTGASEVASFAEGGIILIGYQLSGDSSSLRKKLADFTGNGAEKEVNLVGVVRKDKLIPPRPAMELEQEDYLYLLTTRQHLPALNATLKVETIKTRTAVVYGDNYLSQLIAGSLLNRHFHVTMLSATESKTAFLKDYFSARRHFQVETGEGTEVKLLRRVKVPETSVFIASKSDDASNLTACLVAKNLGVGKTVATIKRDDMLSLCSQAGVDANIAPRLAAAKVIQKMVHENKVLSYRAVSRANLEVIEVEAKPDCKCTRAPIRKLKLPEGVIIGALISAGVPCLAGPEDHIRQGDKAIVLTPPEHILAVEKFFGQ